MAADNNKQQNHFNVLQGRGTNVKTDYVLLWKTKINKYCNILW